MVECLLDGHDEGNRPVFPGGRGLGLHILEVHVHHRFKWWEWLIGRRCIHCTERKD